MTTETGLIPRTSQTQCPRAHRNKPSRRLEAARQWLRDRLAGDPVPTTQVKAEARAAGHKLTTLELASRLEGVEKTCEWIEDDARRLVRRYYWGAAGTKAARAAFVAGLEPVFAGLIKKIDDERPRKRNPSRPETPETPVTAEELAREREELARTCAALEAEVRERWARWDAEDAAKEAAQKGAKNPPENPAPL